MASVTSSLGATCTNTPQPGMDQNLPTFTPLPQKSGTPTGTPTANPWNFENFGPIACIQVNMDRSILLWNLNGSAGQILFSDQGSSTRIETHFSWSPDGRSIAFHKSYYNDIYILSVEDRSAINITQTGDAFEMDPAWSPDGQWIAFTYFASGQKTRDIAIIHPDGTGKIQLTQCDGYCTSPSWSPDGESIAFSRDNQIWVMKADGSQPKALTHNALNQKPAWSPDGTRIAFIRSLDTDQKRYLYLMNIDGSGLRALTGKESNVWSPLSWSPDGRYIVFEYTPGTIGNQLHILNVQTGELKQIKDSFAYVSPAWYPLMESGAASEETPVVREDCTNGWTRLTAGGQAKVMGAPSDLPNRVRSEPVVGNNIIGEIYPGTILRVLEGPVCANGLVFWKVESETVTGWTAEGDGTEYYLEVYVP